MRKKTVYETTAIITESGSFKKTTTTVRNFHPKHTLSVDMFNGMSMRFNERNGLYIAHANGKEYTSYGPSEVKEAPKAVTEKKSLIKRLLRKT
jgi:hypothetical protein